MRLSSNEVNSGEATETTLAQPSGFIDLHVLELWQQRRYREFIDMLPDYAVKCNGEGGMADTIMLFAVLGWSDYGGKAEQLCGYFPSSGSGQVNVEFHVGG
jgi:3,4-dihydroxyphenylacetate 2,3-dioxygenase